MPVKKSQPILICRWIGGFAMLLLSLGAIAQALNSSIQGESRINKSAAGSQKKIDTMADQTQDIVADFRTTTRRTDSLRIYNDQLQKYVDDQTAEISSIDTQLIQLESTNRGVEPLLLEMIDMLEKLVISDMPFLLDEREERIEKLRDSMDRSDVTTSEKYRKVMEAYQTEMEYGRKMIRYEAKHPDTGRTVRFLLVGRTVLAYQSLDGKETGWWNAASGRWEALDESYRQSITDALRMANRETAPDLVNVPVPAAVNAR